VASLEARKFGAFHTWGKVAPYLRVIYSFGRPIEALVAGTQRQLVRYTLKSTLDSIGRYN